jgi:hypothetical protein
MANQAACIDAEKAPIRVGEVEKYQVEPHTILVKNMCIAFSPIEAKIQKLVFQSSSMTTRIQQATNMNLEFSRVTNLSLVLDTPLSPFNTLQSSAGLSQAS